MEGYSSLKLSREQVKLIKELRKVLDVETMDKVERIVEIEHILTGETTSGMYSPSDIERSMEVVNETEYEW